MQRNHKTSCPTLYKHKKAKHQKRKFSFIYFYFHWNVKKIWSYHFSRQNLFVFFPFSYFFICLSTERRKIYVWTFLCSLFCPAFSGYKYYSWILPAWPPIRNFTLIALFGSLFKLISLPIPFFFRFLIPSFWFRLFRFSFTRSFFSIIHEIKENK